LEKTYVDAELTHEEGKSEEEHSCSSSGGVSFLLLNDLHQFVRSPAKERRETEGTLSLEGGLEPRKLGMEERTKEVLRRGRSRLEGIEGIGRSQNEFEREGGSEWRDESHLRNS